MKTTRKRTAKRTIAMVLAAFSMMTASIPFCSVTMTASAAVGDNDFDFRGMGIAAVASTEYAWRSDSKKKRTEDEDGAQIDLLIERGDGVINICEMKWSSGEFTITKKDDAELRNKVEVFQYQTGTKSAIMLTMITTFGVKHNVYYDTIQSEITIDQMFV